MNNDEIAVSPKQLFMFLGIAGVIVIAILIFLFMTSGKKTETSQTNNGAVNNNNNNSNNDFLGEKGIEVKDEDGNVYIDESEVIGGNIHYFNFISKNQKKTIYFFIIKASDGTYRAAANACEVCFGAKKGFTQVGDLIRCENCQVTYPKDKIALEKGGCNPGPIDKNASVENGKLKISVNDIENVGNLF